MSSFAISGNIVDIINKDIFPGVVHVENEKIKKIEKTNGEYSTYIMPGFIDAHVHIESSMLVPTEFARMAAVHGTVATVSDPHEIANVLGVKGVIFMIENASKTPFKFYFGAPSCVPATPFETSGASVGTDEIRELLKRDEIKYLSEMMNFPGVLQGFDDVMEKLSIAKEFNKPIDGHAPGLKGRDIEKYINAGISTDHECFTLNEAVDKIYYGMKILIREGSAAKNFDELFKIIEARPEMAMLCSDDKHPDDLALGHINLLVKRAIAKGVNVMNALRAAILNPIEHYNLDVGLLREGEQADFIEVEDLKDFKVLKTYIDGQLAAENGKSLLESVDTTPINKFETLEKTIEDFKVSPVEGGIRVIEALDGQLITNELFAKPKIEGDNIVSDIKNDILKIAVINRYKNAKPAVAFIKNFGLNSGAIASSVGHDSHNIIAVGVSDSELTSAVNSIIQNKGGMAVASGKALESLPLPVAGLMSAADAYSVAEKYSKLDKIAKELGSKLRAPFMTLSFMALLVIPKLKLSDKGLFDGENFEFINLAK